LEVGRRRRTGVAATWPRVAQSAGNESGEKTDHAGCGGRWTVRPDHQAPLLRRETTKWIWWGTDVGLLQDLRRQTAEGRQRRNIFLTMVSQREQQLMVRGITA
jgi:hypothetical protein